MNMNMNMNMNKELVVSVEIYYDEYEKYDGDGFYPIVILSSLSEKMIHLKKTHIEFQYDKIQKAWIQKTEDMIRRLDGDYGKKLLNILNEKGVVNGENIYTYLNKKLL